MVFLFSLMPDASADDLQVSLQDYTPKPVVPGNFFTATFKVDNTASQNLSNITINLDVDSPFYIEGNDELEIDSLAIGKSKTFSFNIGVKSSASSGFETLNIDWETENPKDSGSESFSIKVKAMETTLVVESVESLPSEIAPGEEAKVKIRLKNEASILLRDIKVKLNLNNAELPFAPIGTVTEKNIDTLNADTSKELEFKIITLADAPSKIYKIPLEITYFDEFGEKYSKTDLISLIIGSKPLLDLNVEKSNLIKARKGTVRIEIVNRGLTDAKFLKVTLISENFELLSPSDVYVGDVDSDDIENVEFDLRTNQQGFINLPLQVTYRDTNNKLYTEVYNVPVKVYTLAEARQAGLIKINYTLFVIITLTIVIIFYFIFRNTFRRKRQRF